MDESKIRNSQSKQIVTKTICNYETDVELTVTYDTGMMKEYCNQLGHDRAWMVGSQRCFKNDALMLEVAEYFGKLAGQEPATDRQITYLISLGVNPERGMSKSRASQLIDFAKGEGVGSVSGSMIDGSY